MPSAENSPGRLMQLDFDALATGAGDTQAEHGTERTGVAVQLPATQPFNGTRHTYVLMPGGFQSTLDALIAAPSLAAAGVPGGQAERQPTDEQPADEQVQPEQTPQPPLDAPAKLPSEVAGSVAAGQYAGNGAGRVRLDEPEPGRQPSRDFRITEAHGVGSGGLHEKANANIAAIRLLQALEAQNREASDEEKAVLVRYAGWGALSQVFEPVWRIKPEWRTAAAELRELLSEQEYDSARATTPNAHFTSPLVINAIWNGLQKLGVSGRLEVLEPAMGVGHFFGFMPESLQGGHRTGVELDGLTARIAQKLYPDSTIFAQGFEATPLPDDYFDVVVSNVPFGDYGVHDPSMKRGLTHAIHDYFFAKSLDKVRPGGVMALITSRYTMDKQDASIRSYLSERADLVGAIRLPNTAFKGNAGTEVTTDILFLQKRAPGQAERGERWTTTKLISIAGEDFILNEYYVRNRDMMLGTLALTGTMYRSKEPTLDGALTQESLDRAIAVLPFGVYRLRGEQQQVQRVEAADQAQLSTIKDGGYGIVEGNVVVRHGKSVTEAPLSAVQAIRVRGLLLVRDCVREVFRTQLDNAPDEQIVQARAHLNHVYDQFVSRFGAIHTRTNARVMGDDPDYPLLLSLETFDDETQTAQKTAVFEKRTIEGYKPVEQVGTAVEALAVSLNETGGIQWERMQALTGMSAKQLQTELGAHVFLNPQGQWETADEYLSGDVRAKLRTAQAAAAINPIYQRNVEALQAVQPEDIRPGEINARLGASWIPASDIQEFMAQLLQVPVGDIAVTHAGTIATWSVKLDYVTHRAVSNTTTYGTTRLTAADLIEDALNMRVPTVYDYLNDDTRVVNQTETVAAREAQQKLKDLFAKWLWDDPGRTERLARRYNDLFNTIRLRTYDGSHLTLPGMNRSELRRGDLDPHQKNAVWRVLQNKNVLIGHCVGAGKTAAIAAACMELKRLGLAKKPMIVVPNHLVAQWAASFLALYPFADIFVAGKEYFSAGNREKAMARIATGTYDAVIISHKSFESLPVSDSTFTRFVQMQIDQLEAAMTEVQAERGDNRSIIKSLEKAKKRLVAKIEDRAGREKKDDGVTFEQLGIDRMFVDEADVYKNLGFTTKMQRIAGLPTTESNRALDMFMKTRYLSERGGGVVFATGTPISNTMAEMYTMQRYLAPELLEAAGVAHFDAWAGTFGEAVTALELAPDGSGYRMHTRFAKFVNLPELLAMFRSFADIQTADMLKLPRPAIATGKAKVMVSPPSAALKTYVATLVERAQRVRSGGVDPTVDNMLTITTDGRKAALDMRLVDSGAQVDAETKLAKAAQAIAKIWQIGQPNRLTQLVFCDMSTPHPDRFNAYDAIRDLLVALGVPATEIAYIHTADSDAKKQALFDAVNTGTVRVLLGSTEKMGAGTNVQQRLVALHHVDAPWRPRDIEQREGRILRQGNRNTVVHIYRYVTEGSFDAYMWQTLETKARFIAQVISGRATVREAEDVAGGALSYAEIKAIASGNPLVMEKVRIDTEVRRLDMLRAAYLNQQYEIGKKVRDLPGQIADAKQYHAGLLQDIARRNAHGADAGTMFIAGRAFFGKDAREQAGKALAQAIMSSLWGEKGLKHLGQYRGFAIMGDRDGERVQLGLRGTHTYEVSLNLENAVGTIFSIEGALRRLDRYMQDERVKIARSEKALADYRAQLGRPFEQEARLRELLVKQADINRSLDLDKSDTQIVAEAKVA
jgi:N12 class adenine-specific DNA methylase